MLRVLGVRVLLAIPLLFAVSLATYALVWLGPGDPARLILGPNVAPERYEQLRQQMGLDRPFLDQYGTWLANALHGDFGVSLFTGADVATTIGQRLPVTVSLVLGTLIVSTVLGLGLGILSALRGGAAGRVIDTFALIGFALPAFWIAAQLIAVFSVKLGWFPSTGYQPFEQDPIRWLQSITLPIAALALGGVAAIAKQTREAMVGALGSPYIRAARANGISERSLVFRHALRNASLTVVTVVGIYFATLLAGTIFVENVFALPGLGSLITTAAIAKDLPTVQAVALFFTVIIVVVNIAVEVLYAWLNPKLRSS